MNEFFFVFLSLSLSGGLIFLLFSVMKPFFHASLSRQWQYYILIIVILRFILPFGPETSLIGGLFSATESVEPAAPVIAAIPQSADLPAETPFQPIPPRPETVADAPFDFEPIKKAAADYFWVFWLAPAILLILRKVFLYRRSVRMITAGSEKVVDGRVAAIYAAVCESMGIRRAPGIAVHKTVPAPMLLGVFRPVIILPENCPEEDELRYIFRHELTHYKRFDIAYKWLVQLTVYLHWYNPLVYFLCREVNRNCELSCDEAVIRALDKNEKYAYGDMLLNAVGRSGRIHALSVHLNEDAKLIKERLISIMNHKKITKASVAVSLALTVCLLCGAVYMGAYMGIFPQQKPAPESTVMQSPAPAANPRKAIMDEIKAEKKVLSNMSYTVVEVVPNLIEGDQVILAEIERDQVFLANIQSAAEENAVIYDAVELRRYPDEDREPRGHRYIHDVKSNHTDKTIIGHERGMLAFDKDGNPLAIDWLSMDDALDGTYFFLYDWDLRLDEWDLWLDEWEGIYTYEELLSEGIIDQFKPGETRDVYGGWSINADGVDPAADKVAYVLYCDKNITFADRSVWTNPDFDDWREKYEGKKVDVGVLENYYPYIQKIK